MSEKPQPAQTPSSSAHEEHPLAVAGQSGYGPLSEASKQNWHGDSAPCVSCARLNRRDAALCTHCGQDLSQGMLQKMAELSGPWIVYDNLRPFPGVSLERILLQIKRGVLQRTTIVRGPTTYYQWRYATETPLIARCLGRCWNCQEEISHDERYCPNCKSVLDGHYRKDHLSNVSSDTLASSPSAELQELSKIVDQSVMKSDLNHLSRKDEKSLGKASLVFFAVAVVVVLAIVFWHKQSQKNDSTASTPTSLSWQIPSDLPPVLSYIDMI